LIYLKIDRTLFTREEENEVDDSKLNAPNKHDQRRYSLI